MSIGRYALETDWLASTAYNVVASSENASYPDDNVKTLRNPFREFHSTGAIETTLIFDMATARTLDAVSLVNVNFAGAYFQGATASTWLAPPFRSPSTGNHAISTERVTGRLSLLSTFSTAFNYRYLRLVIPAQTPTDGAAFFRIGGVALVDTLRSMPAGFDMGLKMSGKAAAMRMEFASGASERAIVGPKAAQISFSLPSGTVGSTAEDALWSLDVDEYNLVMLDLNRGRTEEVYFCRKSEISVYSWDLPTISKGGLYVFDQVI